MQTSAYPKTNDPKEITTETVYKNPLFLIVIKDILLTQIICFASIKLEKLIEKGLKIILIDVWSWIKVLLMIMYSIPNGLLTYIAVK